MPVETNRRLAAILFADIVGYTALMQKDEINAASILNRFKKEVPIRVTEHQGQVEQFYGDGVLCTFQNPLAAMHCAMSIQKSFQESPQIPLRIGIHSGTVVSEGGNIYGDSVNLTSRIESMGISGGVLFSKKIRDELKNQPNLQMTSLGAFEFKNVEEPMEIFALANKGFSIPQKNEIQDKFKPITTNPPFYWQLPIGLAILIAILGLYWWIQKNPSLSKHTEKPSIAVLPFRDISIDRDQEYFGDGISEEILNTLSQLEALKVVSRTSSFTFKEKALTITEIGKILKVDHVLEGSVRKQGDKVRITAQLIKVEDGFHLWSDTYDRDFKDIFKIQDEVAQKIGEVLLKELVPNEKITLQNRPTQNSEAYALFLKAKYIHLNRYYGNFDNKDFKLSEELFLKSIQLDSTYALAYAGLADLYDTHKDVLSDTSDLRYYELLKIKNSELAWQINPNLPYVNIVRGWVMRNKKVEPANLELAYKSFLKGYQLNPNEPDGLFGLAFLYEDKNLLADADKLLDRMIELDPLRSANYSTKGDFLMRAGKFDLAVAANLAALEVSPSDLLALSQLAMNYTLLHNKEKALATYEQINKIDPDFLERIVIHKKILAFLKGEIAIAREIPVSAMDYRGENVILNSLIGEEAPLEASFLEWWAWWKNFKSAKVFSQSSAYLELLKNPIYDKLRRKPWFQEILQLEKEKYDRFFVAYPRAEEILTKSTEIEGTAQKKIAANSEKTHQKHIPYLLLLLSGVLGLYFLLKRPKRTIIEPTVNSRENIASNPIDKEKEDPFLTKLKAVIEENLSKTDFTLPYICKAMGYSRAQLYRKIKELTGTSPSLYIRTFRLQKAKELLKNTDLSISEIAYQVGFKNLSYFSRSFSEEFGISPSESRI